MSRKLTLKQRNFIKEFVKDGNGTRSVRVAYPNIKTEKARGVMSSRLLGNDKIREQIDQALEAQGLTPGVVMEKFITIADKAKYDRDKISAWRNVADIAGFTNKGPSVVVGQQQFTGDINDVLDKLRNPKPIDCTINKAERITNDCLPENKVEDSSIKQ